MKKLLILCLIMYFIFMNTKSKNITIPNDAIRLRVIANSNNEYDQKVKLKLSIEIEKIISELLGNTKDITKARQIIKNNIDFLNKSIEEYLNKEKYSTNYTIVYGNNYFPNKLYNGITYNEGIYESLVITLGKGKGKNWWCVLFPPLCLVDEENKEYKIFVQEILKKYL